MANPQAEDGHTKIANEIMDALARIRIPGEARQVLDFILRKTYGWHKQDDQISLSQFSEGTGLSKVHICRGITVLMKINLITQKGNVTQKGKAELPSYGFQKNYDEWIPLPKKVTLPKKVKGVTQKGNKPITQKGNYKRNTLRNTKATLTKETYVALFEIFWRNFPERDGKKTGQAETFNQYCQLNENELPLVNKAALNFANSRRVKEGIGICDPIRFLIKGRGKKKFEPWRDWITPEKIPINLAALDIDALQKGDKNDESKLDG